MGLSLVCQILKIVFQWLVQLGEYPLKAKKCVYSLKTAVLLLSKIKFDESDS